MAKNILGKYEHQVSNFFFNKSCCPPPPHPSLSLSLLCFMWVMAANAGCFDNLTAELKDSTRSHILQYIILTSAVYVLHYVVLYIMYTIYLVYTYTSTSKYVHTYFVSAYEISLFLCTSFFSSLKPCWKNYSVLTKLLCYGNFVFKEDKQSNRKLLEKQPISRFH